MEENKLDKYFQDKLADHSEEPPPAVWDGISDQLPKGGTVWNKRYLLWLLLLVSVGGAAFLGYRLYEMDSRVAELEEKVKTEENRLNENRASDDKMEGSPENIVNPLSNEAPASSSEKPKVTTSAGGHNSGEAFSETANSEKQNQSGESTTAGAENTSDSQVTPGVSSGLAQAKMRISEADGNEKVGATARDQAGAPTNRTNYSTPAAGKSVTVADVLTGEPTSASAASFGFNPSLLSKRVPVSSQRPAFNAEPHQTDYYRSSGKDWRLFVFGMANYTHRRIVAQNEGGEAIPNRLDKIENGLITPGAGLQLSRELGNHFRLSLGVEYNQWIQEGNYSALVPVESLEVTTITAGQEGEYSFAGSVDGSLGSIGFSSTSTRNPFSTTLESLSPASELEIDILSKRRIDYLSIPITLEYVYNAYPFTISVGGGIVVNSVIGSDVEYTLSENAPDLNIRPNEEIRGTYFAFQAGVAVEYGLTERMAFRLNPSYRGWMTPIFENEEIRTLPFGVAVRAGVVYQFGKK